MKNFIKNRTKIVLITLVLFGVMNTKAAAPNWSVNAASFQYNMTILSVININCSELKNQDNMIGVFVGSECRGVAYTNQVVSLKYLASLFVYSNNAIGDTLTVKIYNITNDSVYDTKVNLQFQQNAAYGTASAPFVIYNNNAPSSLSLNADKVREKTETNTPIATISATDMDPGETFTYSLVAGNGDNDNARFRVQGDKLQVAANIEYKMQSSCSIRLQATDANGCSLEKEFILNVISNEILPFNNYISPNGDGVNDYFSISNIESYADFTLTVYNEYGLEVYKIARDYNNNWDGKYNGKALPSGAYYFVLNNYVKKIEYKGILNIVNNN